MFFECAQSLGRRVVREAAAGNRAGCAFRLCLIREATPAELRTVSDLYQSQRGLLEKDPAAAQAIIGNGDRPADVSPAELAAWVMVGRTLMNLDEFVTRE